MATCSWPLRSGCAGCLRRVVTSNKLEVAAAACAHRRCDSLTFRNIYTVTFGFRNSLLLSSLSNSLTTQLNLGLNSLRNGSGAETLSQGLPPKLWAVRCSRASFLRRHCGVNLGIDSCRKPPRWGTYCGRRRLRSCGPLRCISCV